MLERLRAKLGKLTQEQASYEVYAKETQYPYSRRVYIPHRPYKKLLPGMEPDRKTIKGSGTNKEDNLERSLRRTKSTIRDLVLCNQFELFATFTFKADRHNIQKCKNKMANWLKNQQKRNGRFEYLIIPEFHKDMALHFHALIKGYKGQIKKAINPKTNKPLTKNGRLIYVFPGYTSGFNNVQKIEQTPESHKKVGSYIRKYITKDMPILFGKNRYWASNSLKRPVVVENPPKWYQGKKPDWMHVSEHGLTMVFNDGVPDAE